MEGRLEFPLFSFFFLFVLFFLCERLSWLYIIPRALSLPTTVSEGKSDCRRCLFPFRKRSLPFLTVDAIIGNQAFCHGRCNICSGLSHSKVTNTF